MSAGEPAVVLCGVRHSTACCSVCRIGYPVACVCGGWIHADPNGAAVRCDRCDESDPAAPLVLAGQTHAPGRADCPACGAGHPLPCVCGGLIHGAGDGAGHGGGDGDRRCDRCGPRYEELDF